MEHIPTTAAWSKARRERKQQEKTACAEKFMAPLELTPQKHEEFQKKAMERFMIKQYELAIQTKFESGDIATTDATMLALSRYNDNKKESTSTHFMVTINIDDKHTWQELHLKVQKCLKKKWVTWWIYALEQRATEAPAKGFHAHIFMARGEYEVARCRKEITNTFRGLVGNDKHVKFSLWTNTEQGIKNGTNYCMGLKKTEKMAKVAYDKVWRAENNLEDYYVSCSSKPNL